MIVKKTIWLLLLAATLLTSCGGDDGIASTLVEDTTAADQDEDGTAETVDSNYTYKLPVIFHVLYQDKGDASQYIPATRLKTLLSYVNNIYKGGLYGESEDCKLQFELAEYDENGNKLSTPGVEYIYYSKEYPIDEEEFMTSKDNAKYIWDPNEYVNVMLYHFKERDGGEVLGLSHMPYTVKGTNQLDGLSSTSESYIRKSQLGYPLCSSINSIYAGQMAGGGYYQSNRYQNPGSSSYTIYSSDIVVTMAHELGHYLGLLHLFTESHESSADNDFFAVADSCADTDYCKDTPSYNRAEYTSYLNDYLSNQSSGSSLDIWALLRRQSCEGEEFYSANIMDYSFSLGYKISADQKARVRQVLMYSPLIPGPKLNGVNKTRATSETTQQRYDRPTLTR